MKVNLKLKEMQLTMDHNTKASFLGGIFFSSVVNIGVEDFITTSILAIVGATVSFFVSIFLKFLYEKLKIKIKK